MRILFCGVAAIALSGCSWLGWGGPKVPSFPISQQQYGTFGQKKDDKCCVGGKSLSRWNIEGSVGAAFPVGGDALTGNQTNAITGITANEVGFGEAYNAGTRVELGGSYALNPNRKFTANGFYQGFGSDGAVDVGTVGPGFAGTDVFGVSTAGLTAPAAVSGELSNYRSYGAEVGLRQYFRPRPARFINSFRPYVEGKAGFAVVNSIDLENVSVGGVAADDVELYDNGVVPTFAGLVGVETPIAPRTTLALETGIRYNGTLNSSSGSLTPGGSFAGINNGSNNWSVPVTLRARYRF